MPVWHWLGAGGVEASIGRNNLKCLPFITEALLRTVNSLP